MFDHLQNLYWRSQNVKSILATIKAVKFLQLSVLQNGNVIGYTEKLKRQLLQIQYPFQIDFESPVDLNDLIVRLQRGIKCIQRDYTLRFGNITIWQ